MNILVTGSHGFIGSHLTSQLMARNNSLKCIDKNINDIDKNINDLDIKGEISLNITSNTDWNLILKGVDVVIHLAGCAQSNFLKKNI